MLGRFLAVDPAAPMYPSWSPYGYTMNNPLKYIDPNGVWVSDANAQKFVDFATKYADDKTPTTTMDCSRLVEVSLGHMAEAGVATAMQDNYLNFPNQTGGFATGAETTNMLRHAEKGHYDMQILNFDIGTMKKGDLIIMEGHVEIVTTVDAVAKTFGTVGASFDMGKIVTRDKKTIDIWKGMFPGRDSFILRITEKREKRAESYNSFDERWDDTFSPANGAWK